MSTLSANRLTDLTGKTILNNTGSILQVGSVYLTSSFTTSSNSYVAVPGFSVTLTPTNSTSRFITIANIYHSNSYPTYIKVCDSVFVNGNAISGSCQSQNDGIGAMNIDFQTIYSPGNTSPQTFAIYTNQVYGNNTQLISGSSTLIVFEVAA